MIRRQQVRQLTDVLGERNHGGGRRRPLVVLGDFNCSWSDETRQLRPLARELGLRAYQPHRRAPTYPSRRPWRRLDWILVSGDLEFAAYRTLPNPVSDHLGVVADLVPRGARVSRGAAEAAGWGISETNRKVKFYSLTDAGRKQLHVEVEKWEKATALVARFLGASS